MNITSRMLGEGHMALVANRAESTVFIFTIHPKTITPAGKVELADTNCGPSLALSANCRKRGSTSPSVTAGG